jgi:hypothetical protein
MATVWKLDADAEEMRERTSKKSINLNQKNIMKMIMARRCGKKGVP